MSWSKSAGKSLQVRLPEVRSDRPEAREPSGSAQGMERAVRRDMN